MTPEQLAASGSEHGIQRALFARINQWRRDPHTQSFERLRLIADKLEWVYAINNAVGRNFAGHGARNKAEGVKKGVADIFVPVPRKHFEQFGFCVHEDEFILLGLYVEMKKPEHRTHKNGGLSDEQVQFRDFVKAQGYAYCVCYTWEEAFAAILQYLGG